MTAAVRQAPLDLLGVGVGPFNLSLAALASTVPGLRAAFLDRLPEFRWHPGLMIEGATVQVPFLADLVSLVAPAHPLSFLSYLADVQRLFPFYFAERLHVDRTEYDDYLRWASKRLPACRFDTEVTSVDWSAEHGAFVVDAISAGTPTRLLAGNIVLGVGTTPSVPAALRPLVADQDSLVLHSADYLDHRDALAAADQVVVIGSGQSGAEVFLDLLRRRPVGRERLRWFARTSAFAPMEYSKLGLEHFTPDYTRFFHGLAEPVRSKLVDAQWQLYKGISAETMAEIHDELYRRSVHCGWPDVDVTPGVEVHAARRVGGRYELDLGHVQDHGTRTVAADGIVLATGYTERALDQLLGPLNERSIRDGAGRLIVGADYRVRLDPAISGALFVQNAEKHTHGVGAPDLGLGAWRAATILNSIRGREVFRLPPRTAFTSFGLARSAYHQDEGEAGS
ncbi:MAG TPA: SidA/IucD/PvdA family monooxygenase [Pseudonocardiaceae bacterium]|nr:SidA/IucD/PvdA family monooxygenase [Pseudonocardiaceae bacterium]